MIPKENQWAPVGIVPVPVGGHAIVVLPFDHYPGGRPHYTYAWGEDLADRDYRALSPLSKKSRDMYS